MSENRRKTEKVPRNKFTAFTDVLLIVIAGAMWYFRDTFGFDDTSLFFLTGLAVVNLIVSRINRRREIENYRTAKELKKIRDEMDMSDLRGDIFFRADKK
ncbi:MAG: hypothetical protein MR038_11110 [Oscillospiraceae bacterium]|nr:hypothetical protein [Oscillospiraceae bacterium]